MRAITPILASFAPFALVATLAFAAAPAAERFPAPAPLPDDPHVLGYAVIPDLKTLLAHAEAAARGFAPMPEGVLAMQAGAALGDPGFANLDPSKPIMILVLSGDGAGAAPEVSAWIPAKAPATYVATAATWHWSGIAADSIAILAQTPEAAQRAQALAPTYAALAKPTADLRLRVGVDRALGAYREQIDTAVAGMIDRMASMPHPPGQADLGGILRLECQGFLAVAKDLRDYQIDLAMDGDTLDATSTIAAVPASPLAKALNAPAATGAQAAALLGPGEGVMTVVGAYDGRALMGYFGNLLRELGKAPGGQPIDERILGLVDDAAEAFDGQLAMRMTVAADGHLGSVGATGIASPQAARRLFEDLSAATAADGPIGKLYADLGLPIAMRFETGVRQSGELAVDRVTFDVDRSKLLPDQARTMVAMMRPSEFVRAPRWMLTAQDGPALDALIERLRAANPQGRATTGAETAFGEGRDLYFDYDVVAVMRATLANATGPGAEAMKPMLDALNGLAAEPPLLGATTIGDSSARCELRVPLKAFADLAGAMRKTVGNGQRRRQPPPQAH